jgi:Flp pilus assembly protein TadG
MRRITSRRVTRNRSILNGSKNLRKGGILVLAAAMMVMILALTALTVDMGYIALTKTQLQSASDAAAHAAGIELVQGTGPNPVSSANVQALPEQAAVAVASSHHTGDHLAAYVDPNRDVRFGILEWNSVTGSWEEDWNTVGPYNLVEVTVHRDQSASGSGDRPLTLFFAPLLGQQTANLSVVAQAAMVPASGFKVPPGSTLTADVVPIAIDNGSWDNLMDGLANDGDNFSYDPVTDTVVNGTDGVPELDIYPDSNSSLPPGNRGTVDFGSANNSTADL